jgi:putative tricarboxylic transport membrane protein
MRQSLLLSDGDPMIFLNRPIAGPITVIALILIFMPLIKFGWDKLKGKPA